MNDLNVLSEVGNSVSQSEWKESFMKDKIFGRGETSKALMPGDLLTSLKKKKGSTRP